MTIPHSNGVVLAGQRALVTGAGSGIGAGIAQALARAGAKVALNYQSDPGPSELLAAQIGVAGGEAFSVQADVAQEDQVKGMFEQVADRLGGVDILICNAWLRCDAPLQALALDDWDLGLRVNLTGQFLCAREAIGFFVRQGVLPEVSASAGKILCIASAQDRASWAGDASGAASRGGVCMLMQAMAREAAAYRVRVNGIAPGAIRTADNRAAWDTPTAETALLERIPYGRMGVAEDVGRAAVWLASDDADYVTGVTLRVDGGMSLNAGHLEGG